MGLYGGSKAVLRAAPMRGLMQGGSVLALLVPEGLKGRKLDGVAGWRVKRPVAAVLNDGGGIGQKPVGVLDALGDWQRSSAYRDE
jgi:hypothetical protein